MYDLCKTTTDPSTHKRNNVRQERLKDIEKVDGVLTVGILTCDTGQNIHMNVPVVSEPHYIANAYYNFPTKTLCSRTLAKIKCITDQIETTTRLKPFFIRSKQSRVLSALKTYNKSTRKIDTQCINSKPNFSKGVECLFIKSTIQSRKRGFYQ